MVGPNYVTPNPQTPGEWQGTQKSDFDLEVENIVRTVNLGRDVVAHDYAYSLTNDQCPWWEHFLDEDLHCLIGMQRARSPELHELRAAVDQAWHARWVTKQGFFPSLTTSLGYESGIPENGNSSARLHENLIRSEMTWEIDLFGRRQREVEAAHRDLEAEVETYRNAMVFLAAEIGLFYTDYRAAEQQLNLQIQNIAFYQEVVRLTQEKLALGGVAQIDLDEAQARLTREQASIPDLERARDAARVELARVVGVYSEELNPILTPNQRMPAPGPEVVVPAPHEVLPLRPDIRKLERNLAGQTARVASRIADLYPTISFNYLWNGGDLIVPVLSRTVVGLLAENTRRLLDAGFERAQIREAEALLQRELHRYQLGLVVAASEVENAVIDLQIGERKLNALSKALQANENAAQRVYDGYRSGLVDVRDIIRIRADLFLVQNEMVRAQDLLAKGTIRLYKALGGIDVPEVPARMIQSDYDVTEVRDNSPTLSMLLSLGRDTDRTLRPSRAKARLGQQPWYHVTPDGTLQNGVPNENPFLNRMWNISNW